MRRRSVGVVVRGNAVEIPGHGPSAVMCDFRAFWPAGADAGEVLDVMTRAFAELAHRTIRKMAEPDDDDDDDGGFITGDGEYRERRDG